MGFPRTLQVKVAGLPKSMVWVLGSIDLRGQGCGDRQDGLDALAADGVVDDAEILAGVLDAGLADDERSADLTYALVQLNGLATGGALDKLVPSATTERSASFCELVRLARNRYPATSE